MCSSIICKAAGETSSWPGGSHGHRIRRDLAVLAPAVLLICWLRSPVARERLKAQPALSFYYLASCNRGGGDSLPRLTTSSGEFLVYTHVQSPPSLLCGQGLRGCMKNCRLRLTDHCLLITLVCARSMSYSVLLRLKHGCRPSWSLSWTTSLLALWEFTSPQPRWR